MLRERLPKKAAPADLLLRHHAATLGMSALILAFPYEMPTWLPEVITTFSGHVNDPAPIQVRVDGSAGASRRPVRRSTLTMTSPFSQTRAGPPRQTTVKKTMADFRRTHQDTWHLDKLAFTEDQLNNLTELLVSPGYYA